MLTAAIMATNGQAPEPIFGACLSSLFAAAKASETTLVIVHPPGWEPRGTVAGVDTVYISELQRPQPYVDRYHRILAGLASVRPETAYIVEHDVLYPLDAFTVSIMPPRTFGYNRNAWHLNRAGFFPVEHRLTSQCVARGADLAELYRARLAWLEAGHRLVWDEPGMSPADLGGGWQMVDRKTDNAAVDVRYGHNLTGDRTAAQYLAAIPGWPAAATLWQQWRAAA